MYTQVKEAKYDRWPLLNKRLKEKLLPNMAFLYTLYNTVAHCQSAKVSMFDRAVVTLTPCLSQHRAKGGRDVSCGCHSSSGRLTRSGHRDIATALSPQAETICVPSLRDSLLSHPNYSWPSSLLIPPPGRRLVASTRDDDPAKERSA